MATQSLIMHGTDRGYRAEIKIGPPCKRCQNAHRVYQTQFRPKGRKLGLKYGTDDVIDHLYKASNTGQQRSTSRAMPSNAPVSSADMPAEHAELNGTESGEAESGQSLGDRLADRIRAFTARAPEQSPYVEEQDTGYVHRIDDADESPGPEWEPLQDEQFIITAQGLKTIEQNLGTYLSVVGITVEMIDPYCGPILAENFDNIVNRWSKVISHYPKAAELFMDAKGGVVFTWIGALQATWPVLYAIYQHHLAKTITVMPDGRIFHKNDVPNPNGSGDFDPLRPDFQYSAT